ncbi:hypothetical protein HPB47_011778 [Ixodes persulcatus]|uniref:Uncharacterized protein n=1 Tax=Ixodes persulcatus TaxID=34615 RepID=A0AC60NVP0_IXOPE|nr:hypothetical protein HPB47_011778 [Ixodes persulcatus]
MGRRYHCDYCDKTFPDNVNNRKKHLQGSHHIRLRKNHYDAFRDAASLFQAESAKKPCRRFQQTGACDYGTACKFSHMSADDLRELELRAENEKAARSVAKCPVSEVTLRDWTEKRLREQGSLPEPFAYKAMIMKHCVGTGGQFEHLVGSSLRPPTLDDLLACRPNSWARSSE